MKNKVFKDMVSNMALRPIGMLLQYIYIPLVISFLGDEHYGVWTIILSIVSYVNYFDIGIGNGLRNKLVESLAQKNRNRSIKLISSSYIITIVISILLFVLGTIIIQCINWQTFLNTSINNDIIKITFIISLFFVCMNFVLSLCKMILFALQRAPLVPITEIMAQIFNISFLIIIMRMQDGNLIYISVLYGVSALIANVLMTFYVFNSSNEIAFDYKKFDLQESKNLGSLGIMFFINQISTLILMSTDNIMISSLFNPIEVTNYSIVYKLFNIIPSLHYAMLSPLWSQFTKAKFEKNYKWINRLIKILVISSLAVFILSILFSIFLDFAMKLWIGKVVTYSLSLVVCMIIFNTISSLVNCYSTILSGLGSLRILNFVSIIILIIKIPLSIMFAKLFGMGVAGVMMGSIICWGIALCIYIPFVRKYLKQKI